MRPKPLKMLRIGHISVLVFAPMSETFGFCVFEIGVKTRTDWSENADCIFLASGFRPIV